MSDATISIGYNLDQLRADAVKAESITKTMAEKAQSALGSLAGAGGIDLSGVLGMFSAPMALVGGIGAIGASVMSTSGDIKDLIKEAHNTEQTVEEMQMLKNMAEATGTTAEDLADKWAKLQVKLIDPNNKEAAEVMAKLGLTMEDVFGGSIVNGIMKISEGYERAHEKGMNYVELSEMMGKSFIGLRSQIMMTDAAKEKFLSIPIFDAKTAGQTATIAKDWGKFAHELHNSYEVIKMNAAVGAGVTYNAAKGTYDTVNDKATQEAAKVQEFRMKGVESLKEKMNQAYQEEEDKEKNRYAMAKKRLDILEAEEKWKTGGLKLDEKMALAEKEKAAAELDFQEADYGTKTNAEGDAKREEAVKRRIAAASKILEVEKEIGKQYQENADLMKQANDREIAKAKKEEKTKNELDELRIEELKNSHRYGAADKLKKDREQRMNEQKIRDDNPDMSLADVKARAQRMRNIEDRKAGIIGRTTNYVAPEKDWGLDHRGSSALDAFGMKGRLDLAAKMGPSRLGHRGPLGHTAMATDAAAHKVTENTALITIQNSALQELKRMSELLAA